MGTNLLQVNAAPVFSGSVDSGSGNRQLPPIAPAEAGRFVTAEDGTRYLSLRFRTEGAAATRLHLEGLHLPAGARLFVYGYRDGTVTEIAGPFTGSGPGAEDSFWTPAVSGTEVILELQQGEMEIPDLPFRVLELASADAPDAQESSVTEERTSLYRDVVLSHKVVDGVAIFEGDIVLEDTALRLAAEREKKNSRSAVAILGSKYRWPNGIIPYAVDPNMTSTSRITAAVAHWNTIMAGYIRLVPRTTESAYVYFYRSPSAGQCASSVGRTGYAQITYIGDSCSTGNVIHEIGHNVGLWHEQSRADRDNYVIINWENLQAGTSNNFTQNITNGIDLDSYDYGSIMHYPANAFSVNGLPTVETIPAGIPIGQRSGLSPGDIAAVKSLYAPIAAAVSTTAVTLTTNPAGMPYVADGLTYTSQQTFNWVPGSVHTVAAANPADTNGTLYTFQSWSDGGAQTHTIVTPTSATAYGATYSVAYKVGASVVGSGAVTLSPADDDNYYVPGTSLTLTASPSSGYCFSSWSGLLPGTSAQTTLSVSQPYNVEAVFQPGTYTTNVTSLNLLSPARNYSVMLTAPAGCAWTAKASNSWIRFISAPSGAGSTVLYLTVDSNPGPAVRSATLRIGTAVINVTQQPPVVR